MEHTKYSIGVISNKHGPSMQELTAMAADSDISLDHIETPMLPLANFSSSDIIERLCAYDVVYHRTGMRGAILPQLAALLHERRVLLVNGCTRHFYIHHKIRQALIAGMYGIPQPKSLYVRNNDYETARSALGDSFVIKPNVGHQGEHVALVRNEADLQSYLQEAQKDQYIMQEFIEHADEYRVYTIGGVGVATYKKLRGETDFRANLHVGGSMTKTEPEREAMLRSFGSHAASSLGADISGVDVLVRDGQCLFLELNLSPGWEQLEELTGVDFCRETLQYLLNRAHTAKPWWQKLV